MTEQPAQAKFKVKPYRRILQILVLGVLLIVPFSTQNPTDWAPSRIIQGQIPAPATFSIFGDTWNFEINGFRLAHPLSFFDTWLSARLIYLPLLVAALIPLGLTILLGRIFCSWLCPVGFLLELNMKVRRTLARLGISGNYPLKDFRYFILFSCLVFAFIFAVPVLSVVDPPHTLGREMMNIFTHHTISFIGAALLFAILFMDSIVASRACCSKLCPSGGGLALLGKYRVLRINMIREKCIMCGSCDESCPYELAPMGLAGDGNFAWTKCDNCGLCRDSCPTGAIEYAY
ncbi:MAG TPA: 4Fe-4S binding protein, partial [Desulfobacteraceae bacterium]|nr:4Fe-4S binding protein [Desulfobacteraceae bacterium]